MFQHCHKRYRTIYKIGKSLQTDRRRFQRRKVPRPTQAGLLKTGVVGFDFPPPLCFFTEGKDSLGNGYPPVKIP